MSKLIVITNMLGELQTNSYIVGNAETREAIVIDPAAEADYICQVLKDSNLKCVGIYLTHGHLDHMAALAELKEKTGAPTYASTEEKEVLADVKLNLSAWLGSPMEVTVDEYLTPGSEVKVLGNVMKCIGVSGHTKGGMCYYFPDSDILFSGDTLFASSVGRSDFPTGDARALIRDITEKLMILPDETIVYPGHNNRTKIGVEKKENPFL
jgi:glyoxylase-like metal-dependent hydrolase (beta-lactamase superfamily II)